MTSPRISVLTPTYNRGGLLERLFSSLRSQTVFDFEWVVIDDGSTDDTREVIANFKKEKLKFSIKYFRQKNSGKHRALNFAVKKARGDFCFIVDSDDFLSEKAIESVIDWLKDLPGDFAGVAGLKTYQNGEIVGGHGKSGYVDATNLDRYRYNLLGDKAEIYRTEILKKYPFPKFKDETFLTEAVVWNRIAQAGHKIRWFNEPIYYCEYLDDGLTRNIHDRYLQNFRGFTLFTKEFLCYSADLWGKIKLLIYYAGLVEEKRTPTKVMSKELNVNLLICCFARFVANLKSFFEIKNIALLFAIELSKLEPWALITVFFHFLLTFLFERVAFDFNNFNSVGYIIAKVISFVCIVLFWKFIGKVLKGDVEAKVRLKFFGLCFMPMFVLFLVIFPGFVTGADIYNFLDSARHLEPLWNLSYLMSLFYQVGPMLFISPLGGTVLLQIILISCIVSNLIYVLWQNTKNKLSILSFLPFTIPVVLLLSYYPNRPIIFGYLFVLMFTMLLEQCLFSKPVDAKRLFSYSIVIALIATLRSEGLYIILAAPVILTICKVVSVFKAMAILFFGLCFAWVLHIPNLYHNHQIGELRTLERNLAILTHPLGFMLENSALISNEEQDVINKNLDLKIVREYPGLQDSVALFNGAYRSTTALDYKQLQKTLLDVYKRNPMLYLEAKYYTFKMSSGIDRRSNFSSMNFYDNMQNFMTNFKLSQPVSYSKRRFVLKVLEGNFSNEVMVFIYQSINNIYLPIFAAFGTALWSLWYKNKFILSMSVMVLIHAAIVFLTAPASYMIYYFPILLCGYLMIIFTICTKIKQERGI